jgi:hypothetical protein
MEIVERNEVYILNTVIAHSSDMFRTFKETPLIGADELLPQVRQKSIPESMRQAAKSDLGNRYAQSRVFDGKKLWREYLVHMQEEKRIPFAPKATAETIREKGESALLPITYS